MSTADPAQPEHLTRSATRKRKTPIESETEQESSAKIVKQENDEVVENFEIIPEIESQESNDITTPYDNSLNGSPNPDILDLKNAGSLEEQRWKPIHITDKTVKIPGFPYNFFTVWKASNHTTLACSSCHNVRKRHKHSNEEIQKAKISSLRYKSDGYVYGNPAAPGGIQHVCETFNDKGELKTEINNPLIDFQDIMNSADYQATLESLLQASTQNMPKIECQVQNVHELDPSMFIGNSGNSSSFKKRKTSSQFEPIVSTSNANGQTEEKFKLSELVIDLVEIAKEMDLIFMFNTSDDANSITFQSKRRKECQIDFIDLEDQIRVVNKVDSNVAKESFWSKADIDQFLYAIRGRCASFLRF